MNANHSSLRLGIDVGSTTVKAVVMKPDTHEVLFARYQRHHAEQAATAQTLLQEVYDAFPSQAFRVAVCGSGGKPIADYIGAHYIQEVVANASAVRALYPEARTAIELGGQDAKIIFFYYDETTGQLATSDMRMNGSCAGGTGAFLDEIAALLKTPTEGYEALAAQGKTLYSISGRCGVFAKTDIQTILNQGGRREDIALSSFHAIAKQTIGGLAQGLEIQPPVIFEGGPLTFNPTLIQVFAQRLGLTPEQIIRPENPDTIVALGAAIAIDELFPDEAGTDLISLAEAIDALTNGVPAEQTEQEDAPVYFTSDEERADWQRRHAPPPLQTPALTPGKPLRVYIGIDAGSTTSKLVLMDEQERVIDRFYANNRGDPIRVVKRGLLELHDKYQRQCVELEVLGLGTTGYGELMLGAAYGADYHTVETVAHTAAAQHYVPDVSFVLDVGGQDMKAIWISEGVVTNITLNEACSSGCGSFLENFAASMDIPVEEIANAAFRAEHPANLGSRCTVFMNSTIITEQKNGRSPDDIMAGLCRSIIKNVFTKVVRISNTRSLGEKVVVQGGTFKNDAVLRALEQYLNLEVTRAPYAGEMGCIGAALLTKRQAEEQAELPKSRFIGWDAVARLNYTQEDNLPCPFCGNHCRRTVVTFSDGHTWVTGNRCERGEILGDPKDSSVRVKLKPRKQDQVPNLFQVREKLLFQDYDTSALSPERGVTIGIPRVLSFWEKMPFWTTFWKALGFTVQISDKSSRKLYESGLSAVTSDTVCFPAKLVHGHIRNLVDKGVDRIFMPSITTVTSENTEATSESMCAVVKGYPIVVRNSDNPMRRWGVPYDAPLFHWYRKEDRDRQLTHYMEETFGISPDLTRQATEAGDRAQQQFEDELRAAGQSVLDEVERMGRYAIVLASRPYQNDPLVNHDLPTLFTQMGIPVLTADSLPEVNQVDLHQSRLDIVNNYHARMLSSAILAARSEHLEYVQLVSFGCGHDAYLSDEIIRLMGDISGKNPLILKLDESDALGSLRIRVRSFVETMEMRHRRNRHVDAKPLNDPYPVKYTKESRKEKVVLIPNTSHAFCRVMTAAFRSQHIKAEPLDIGRENAIRLGKQYVHNDICFPAQIVIGEALSALKSGKYDPEHTAIGMGKYIGDCRLTHYSALLRKALDDAGFANVPIITNDDVDSHNMHPGFRMNLLTAMRIAFAMPMIDALEELLRKIRPYEQVPGSANQAFEEGMDALVDGLEKHGISGAKKGFTTAIDKMKQVRYDRSHPRSQVLIVGEYLLNFHPGANHDIEDYLERNGFEIIEARMTDVIRKTYFYQDSQVKEYHLKKPLRQKAWLRTADEVFELAHDLTDSIAERHPLYSPACRMPELVKDSDPIIHHTFDAGEGVLIPGEILHHAKHGCRAFIILQPFGCLPNHVVGRGVAKRIKEMYPDAQILPLDYDPDVSFANIENRLQMLIMSQKSWEAEHTPAPSGV